MHFGEGKETKEKELAIELDKESGQHRCPCGAEFDAYYDKSLRMVMDLPYGPYKRSWLCFMQARVDCPGCGAATEDLSFCDPRATYTKRLAAEGALSCREARSLNSSSTVAFSKHQVSRHLKA